MTPYEMLVALTESSSDFWDGEFPGYYEWNLDEAGILEISYEPSDEEDFEPQVVRFKLIPAF